MSNFNLILKIDKGLIGLLKPFHFPLSLFSFNLKNWCPRVIIRLRLFLAIFGVEEGFVSLNFLVNNFLTIPPPFFGCGK
jgi:hypothetical protein